MIYFIRFDYHLDRFFFPLFTQISLNKQKYFPAVLVLMRKVPELYLEVSKVSKRLVLSSLLKSFFSTGSIIIWKPSSNQSRKNIFKRHKILEQIKVDLVHPYSDKLLVVIKGLFQIYQIDQFDELKIITIIESGMNWS